MEKQAFLEQYRVNSGMSKKEMEEFLKTQLVVPCDCGCDECKELAIITNNHLSINSHLDLNMKNDNG